MLKLKQKLKVAVLAVGMFAAAGANAALNKPINGATAGDGNTYGSLILNVWDGTNKLVRDLGTIDTWLSNNSDGTLTQTSFGNTGHIFSAGSLFSSLFGTPNGTVRWNVMAAFTDQINGLYNGVATTGGATTNFNQQNAETGIGNVETYFGAINPGTVPALGEKNVTSLTAAGQGTDNFFTNSSGTSAAVGNSLSFFAFLDDLSTPNTGPTTKSTFAGTFSLASDGTLNYTVAASPVPVPGALLLLGSGLFGLVTVGRRRKS